MTWTAIGDALLRLVGATAFMVVVVVAILMLFHVTMGSYLDGWTEGRWRKYLPVALWIGVGASVLLVFVVALNFV